MYDAFRHPQAQWYPACNVCMAIKEDCLGIKPRSGSEPTWAWPYGSAPNHPHEFKNHQDAVVLSEEFARALAS